MQFDLSDQSRYQSMCAYFAAAIRSSSRGLVFGLNGDLGVGKTHFVRNLFDTLGVTGSVKSPTFTLIESYSFNGTDFHHMDCYRLSNMDDLALIGFHDLSEQAFVFIEWARQIDGLNQYIDVMIDIQDLPSRSMKLEYSSKLGKYFIAHLTSDL